MSRPVLHTDRLVLDPLTSRHLDPLVDLDSDPQVMRFLTGRAASRDEVVETWLPRRTDPAHDASGLGYWVAHHAGAFVGWFCLTPRAAAGAGVAELGYRLRRSEWGRGFATEGASRVVDHGFASVGLEVVVAETMAVNTASRRVLERLGLAHVRTEHREWSEPLPGAEHGEVVYELTRQAWYDRAR